MSNHASCPRCGAKIKDGFLGVNQLLEDSQCELIAEMTNTPKEQACASCRSDAFYNAISELRQRRDQLAEEIVKQSEIMPIVTAPSPMGWNYRTIGMATGQSTSGTGFLTEVSASWTDFFGMQSGAYNKKISEGELLCYRQLRSKALQMGGNAVVATDIDYSEMGAAKGMVMVCMSGTVVKIENTDVVSDVFAETMLRIDSMFGQLRTWDSKYSALYNK
ncbi:hypothetical protein DCC81_12150 [Chitinophaga parva]|uniref:Heavy metal-binding domain-containing protein n=1 Tax=Chitinophaga parva TaxID=2169414 RepID=A0A2T7BFJ7_9BACT|nr:heavy metal-binding domain-containing protein [Chitinophaga parva]PUZ25058.1 hypothetical protein DCC81_12150 [Chitinophaga parva]